MRHKAIRALIKYRKPGTLICTHNGIIIDADNLQWVGAKALFAQYDEIEAAPGVQIICVKEEHVILILG